MIRDFAASYQKKPLAQAGIFGIKVNGPSGGEWTVEINPDKKAVIKNGLPHKPTFYYTTDLLTLKKIYNGELSAMTAVGRARNERGQLGHRAAHGDVGARTGRGRRAGRAQAGHRAAAARRAPRGRHPQLLLHS